MSSEYHWFGLDIQFAANGDDASASGIAEINQRIVRELMTAPGDYVWQPNYGAGLGRYIGVALSAEKYAEVTALIRSIVVKQPDVQRLPAPAITFQADATGLLSTQIVYTYAPTGQPVTVFAP
ncbi:MAG: phage tail protein [Burkholderiaceae bacterium]|nr:phage tail protein [Burkholderiaceae bacterium]